MDTKYTILVAEDDALMRGALVAALGADARVSVLDVNNGKDALIFALEKHPDLITLDVAMPTLDGISVLRRLREDAWGRQAKVILLTSLGGSDVVMNEVGKLNPAHCLIKDKVSINEVVEKAYKLLDIAK
jgi:CheY-like chemotaxis protein